MVVVGVTGRGLWGATAGPLTGPPPEGEGEDGFPAGMGSTSTSTSTRTRTSQTQIQNQNCALNCTPKVRGSLMNPVRLLKSIPPVTTTLLVMLRLKTATSYLPSFQM